MAQIFYMPERKQFINIDQIIMATYYDPIKAGMENGNIYPAQPSAILVTLSAIDVQETETANGTSYQTINKQIRLTGKSADRLYNFLYHSLSEGE